MIRKDLRGENDLRPFSVELGLATESDGSAAVSFGYTKVVASVVGPAPPKYGRHELYDRASIEIDIQIPSKSIVEGSDVMQQKRRYERFLLDALDGCVDVAKFPRTLILFNVLITTCDGSILEVMLNACVLALLDAHIPMLFVPTAVAISVHYAEGSKEAILLLDPTSSEEADSSANCTVVLRVFASGDPSAASVVASECTGLLSIETYCAVNALAIPNGQEILTTMKKFMEAKLGVGSS